MEFGLGGNVAQVPCHLFPVAIRVGSFLGMRFLLWLALGLRSCSGQALIMLQSRLGPVEFYWLVGLTLP
jgi:hypothetical protein